MKSDANLFGVISPYFDKNRKDCHGSNVYEISVMTA